MNRAAFSGSDSVPAMLDTVARKWPDAVAVESDETVLTWREISAEVERLAVTLEKAGARDRTVIAIPARRDPRFLVAVLAVWRIGCAYTVIDESWPLSRLGAMMKACGCQLVCDGSTVTSVSMLCGPGYTIRDESQRLPDGASYLLFTSGSTGSPKGAVVGHPALANTITYATSWLRKHRGQAHGISLAPLYYDAALLEILPTLAVGGRVFMAGPHQRMDPDFVLGKILAGQVNWLVSSPSWLRVFADAAGARLNGTLIVSGGEPLRHDTAQRLLACGCDLWNVYGPTETAVIATNHRIRITDRDPLPVGFPLPGVTITVADPELQPLPPGEIGEIIIGGAGVGLGYLDDPDRTRAAFTNLPDGRRCYRTGDLGRLSPDGLLTVHGRLDGQVKVNGNRIELGDIETNAKSCTGVTDAMALLVDRGGHKRVALLVTGAATSHVVRDSLKGLLPGHMQPNFVIAVDTLPLTERGKRDRIRAEQIVAEEVSTASSKE